MFFTGLLLVIFALGIAYATFVENDFGTITAKILIYNSLWFEVLLAIMVINLSGSIIVNKLISKKKWPIFLFHVAFIIIIIGAAVTRYNSFEGSMHIREGETSNFISSDASYIRLTATENGQSATIEKEVKFSGYTSNRFSESLEINNKIIKIQNLQFVPSADETIVEDFNGEPIISILAVSEGMQRVNLSLTKGTSKKVDNVRFGFESPENSVDVNFTESNGIVSVVSTDSLLISGMMANSGEVLPAKKTIKISTQKVYQAKDVNFVFKQFNQKGRMQLMYNPPESGVFSNDAFLARITVDDASNDLVVYGKKGIIGETHQVQINGIDISVTYGAKIIELPFALKLIEFQLERYPGSNSPSSYASEVELIDKTNNFTMPFRIYMNNILKYNGYRFFQASYDTDEKGTVLSVNHDQAGTAITYFGYLIMAIGMVLTLFNKNSRFKKLIRASAKLSDERKKLFTILAFGLFFSFSSVAQISAPTQRIDNGHVAAFSELLIQNHRGRIEPVNTLASEILRKVSKKGSIEGMSASEVFLDMHINAEKWKSIPIIKVANPELRKFLGTSEKLVPFNSIVNSSFAGNYKLRDLVQKTYEKKPNERNKYDKEIINVDERVNILMSLFTGNFLTIFPVPGHSNNKWASLNNLSIIGPENAEKTQATINSYFQSISESKRSGDWRSPNGYLKVLKENQKKYGADIIPPAFSIKLEVFYNNFNIFGKLSKFYMLVGFILLTLQFISIFKPKVKMGKLKQIGTILAIVLFISHTFGLIIRWYISGHAPWSNGYESMIFIGWATCLAGLIFIKRSEITLSLTLILAGLALMVAGMSWMSPEITDLVPVLKSYWLIVHVAIITASYGFLGICALLGLLNLILMIFRTEKNAARINFTIKELVYIIQIALIIGLFMLTLGSFIGGVWANESWGRYWGWDPKETWALVTIIVYSFITHMHKIPGFRGSFAHSTAMLVGFASVLMTFFGVNYYLSGLHSYAQGEPPPIPMGVYIALFLIVIIVIAAYISEKKGKSNVVQEDIEDVSD